MLQISEGDSVEDSSERIERGTQSTVGKAASTNTAVSDQQIRAPIQIVVDSSSLEDPSVRSVNMIAKIEYSGTISSRILH